MSVTNRKQLSDLASREAPAGGPLGPKVEAGFTRPDPPPFSRRDRWSDTALRWASTLLTLLVLALGLYLAEREEFIPDEGVGYWLGIIGGTALLVQLAYPMRKRLRAMRGMGSMAIWFRLHMFLGIAGPLLILYHCNYSLGAVNSNVALIAMLLVAGSGLVGRYIYGKLHNGLYGARSTVHDLLDEATRMLRAAEGDVTNAGGSIAGMLTEFGVGALRPDRSILGSFGKVLSLTFSVPFARSRIRGAARRRIVETARQKSWSRSDRRQHENVAASHIDAYFKAVVKAAEFSFYERIFGLWHILHMPLYILLILTGIAHVIAVHLY